MKWWMWVLLGMWIVVLVGLGCSPTTDVGDPDDPINRDTPDGLLNFLAVAYADKDADGYDEALHDSFQFQFTDEVAKELGLPPEQPWWGKTRDLVSTVKMFGSSEVQSITMRYYDKEAWEPFDLERPDGSTFSGVWTRVDPDITVTVDTPGEEIMTYWVNASWLDVFVVPDPDSVYEGLWVFLEIQEYVKDDD